MPQPIWKLIQNLGDANPTDHGGYFVFQDETGVYPPEAELLEIDESNGSGTVHRFILDRCTFIDGILSDNRFHPDKAAWWATPEAKKADRPQDTTYLSNVANTVGIDPDELIRLFTSDNPLDLAVAYRAVGDTHGFDNLDSDPLELTEDEVAERYNGEKYKTT